jgi:hypothetical protein
MAKFFSPADMAFQPARKFRFIVSFSNLGMETSYMVTKAQKPSFEVSNSTEHRILNHTFKFPGIVKWNDIDISLIDAIDPNVGSKFYNLLRNMGYVQPVNIDALAGGISKVQANSALGTVTIKQLDAGGIGELAGNGDLAIEGAVSNAKYHSEWTLKNAFLKSVKFGDLDYTSEDIISIDLGLTYDYASYTEHGDGKLL